MKCKFCDKPMRRDGFNAADNQVWECVNCKIQTTGNKYGRTKTYLNNAEKQAAYRDRMKKKKK